MISPKMEHTLTSNDNFEAARRFYASRRLSGKMSEAEYRREVVMYEMFLTYPDIEQDEFATLIGIFLKRFCPNRNPTSADLFLASEFVHSFRVRLYLFLEKTLPAGYWVRPTPITDYGIEMEINVQAAVMDLLDSGKSLDVYAVLRDKWLGEMRTKGRRAVWEEMKYVMDNIGDDTAREKIQEIVEFFKSLNLKKDVKA